MERIIYKASTNINLSNPSFDLACHMAYKNAIALSNIDEDGHSDIKDYDRSDCHIEVVFKKLTISGSYFYEFEFSIIKNED